MHRKSTRAPLLAPFMSPNTAMIPGRDGRMSPPIAELTANVRNHEIKEMKHFAGL